MIAKDYEENLRSELKELLRTQGFLVNPHLRPALNSKAFLRQLHEIPRLERIHAHKRALSASFPAVKECSVNGKDLNPARIRLQLKEVRSGSNEERLFFWWNLVWWSLPYERMIGRQLRFLLWDEGHQAPFGLVGLQSPLLKMASRDSYLGLKADSAPYWINQSLTAQRVGALPPYNQLLGSKMAAYTLSSNEIRECYSSKYTSYTTLLDRRQLPPRLLFVTTTSAFGRSSVFDRLRFGKLSICKFLGYTSGSGTFHISDALYEKLLNYLVLKGENTKRGYGTGPSRKLKLIGRALAHLGLSSYGRHNISRGVYLFPQALNFRRVIQEDVHPKWFQRPFDKLVDHWMYRWCEPRSKRNDEWNRFDSKNFFKSASKMFR